MNTITKRFARVRTFELEATLVLGLELLVCGTGQISMKEHNEPNQLTLFLRELFAERIGSCMNSSVSHRNINVVGTVNLTSILRVGVRMGGSL